MKPVTVVFRGRELTAPRAPTHAECDVALVEALIGLLLATQARIVAAEAEGADGCSVVIAQACRVANDAAREIRARVLGAAKGMQASPPELEDPVDGVAVQACIEWFGGLQEALGVSRAALGK